MRVTAKWIDGLWFRASSKNEDAVFLDQRAELGGSGKGVQPMIVFLYSLAGCTGMDVMSILKKKRIKVDAFEVIAEGERAPYHPKKYTKITLTFRVKGEDVTREAIEHAVELSYRKYCPIIAMIKDSTEIIKKIEIETED